MARRVPDRGCITVTQAHYLIFGEDVSLGSSLSESDPDLLSSEESDLEILWLVKVQLKAATWVKELSLRKETKEVEVM